MKRIALLIGALSVATTGFAADEFSGNTTCYLYKQDKLQKQMKCNYKGVEGDTPNYAFKKISYTLPGYKTMRTASNIGAFNPNGQAKTTITLNDEPAIIRYRSPTNLSIVSAQYADSGKETLECYLSTKSKLEICYK